MALKILLADDSMIAQNMGKKILSDAGYDVIPVSNGAAAVKRLPDVQPDIVLLDVYMPGYTGLEVCEKIKNNPATANVPVLLTVGKLEPFRPEDGMKVKADGVIVKPFEATDLIAVVAKLAERLLSPPVAPSIPAEPMPAAVEAEEEMEIAAPPPALEMPSAVAAAPAMGDDFLNELQMETPAAPAGVLGEAVAVAAAPASAEVAEDFPLEISFSADEEPTVAPTEPVPPADVQAAVAGMEFFGVPQASATPVAPAAESVDEADAELPPIEIYLEAVGDAEETPIKPPEPAAMPAPAPSTTLPGLEPTLQVSKADEEIAPIAGLMSDYNESPVEILNEPVAPPEASGEEPPEFSIFNAVLSAESNAQTQSELPEPLPAYEAAAEMAEPLPAEAPASAIGLPEIVAEAAPEPIDTPVPSRVTDAEQSEEMPESGIGLAMEAMLSGEVEPMTFEVTEAEADEPEIEIAAEAPAAMAEAPPAAIDIPVETVPEVVEEQPLEITLESIMEATEAEDFTVSDYEAAPEPLETPVPADDLYLEEEVVAATTAPAVEPEAVLDALPTLEPESPAAEAVSAPVTEVPPTLAANSAEQIVDHVLQRIRPELIEEVKRLLARG